ncbi:hypothetical protein ACJZ2D_008148 [Fusarium nematophilum]
MTPHTIKTITQRYNPMVSPKRKGVPIHAQLRRVLKSARARATMTSTVQAVTRIRGTPVPQLTELIDGEDDWSGVTDAASRRRLQNRLNVRAYRRRKALEAKDQADSTCKPEPQVPHWIDSQQAICLLPSSTAPRTNRKSPPLVPHRSSTRRSKPVMFPLSPDHLIVLLQFNVLRACLANRELIAPLGSSPVAECASAAEHILPCPSNPRAVPPSLLPTALQSTIPHEGWVDIIPHPVWRDNVLLALGQFDEDELWSDVMGGLFEGFPGSEVEHRGVIAWSPPWDASGWEMSEGFVRKWGWSFRGCEELLVETNRWRQKRGVEPIVFEIP